MIITAAQLNASHIGLTITGTSKRRGQKYNHRLRELHATEQGTIDVRLGFNDTNIVSLEPDDIVDVDANSADHPEPAPAPGISFPTTRFILTYGLNARGVEIISTRWQNLADPDAKVDMLSRVGLLAMAEQGLTGEAFGLIEEREDDE